MAIAHVQTKGTQGTAPEASRSLTFDSATSSGNLIVVCVSSFLSGGATYTVTDNKSNTYTSARRQVVASGIELEIFYAKNIAGGATHQITVTPNASAYLVFSIGEYSGADTTAPLDQVNSGSGGSTSPNSGNITTTAAGLVIGAMSHNSGTVTITPGATYTQRYENENTSSAIPIAVEDKIVAAGTYSADWTTSGSVGWGAAVASFKEASGGAPITLAGSAATAAWSAPTGSLSAPANLSGAAATATWTAPAGALEAPAVLAGGAAAAAWTAPTGTLHAPADLAGAPAVAAWSAPGGSLLAPANLAGGVASAAWSAPAGTLLAPANLAGGVASASWSAPAGVLATPIALTGAASVAAWSAQAGVLAALQLALGYTPRSVNARAVGVRSVDARTAGVRSINPQATGVRSKDPAVGGE